MKTALPPLCGTGGPASNDGMPQHQSPSTDIDIFSDEVLADPWPAYKTLRDLGGAVYLSQHDVWALPRYETVRFALANHELFTSDDGVAMSDDINFNIFPDIILHDDGEPHRKMRSALQTPLTARAVARLTAEIGEEAQRLVGGVLQRSSFDAVKEIAEILPVSVVARLTGLPEDRRMKLLDWADGAFTTFGPMNDRARQALPQMQGLFEYLSVEAAPGNLAPDSWGAAIYAAGERGDLPPESCLALMIALVTAGMETTISTIAALFALFAQYPGEWEKVRARPELAEAAFNEAVRLESPILTFTRVARRDFTTGTTVVPAGSRTVVMYGSANHDERQWPDPDAFDVGRDARQHVGFGYGLHYCVGQPLARIQVTEVIRALIPRVARFQAGPLSYGLNNISRRLQSLPVTVTAP